MLRKPERLQNRQAAQVLYLRFQKVDLLPENIPAPDDAQSTSARVTAGTSIESRVNYSTFRGIESNT